jgi:hypothetical protein
MEKDPGGTLHDEQDRRRHPNHGTRAGASPMTNHPHFKRLTADEARRALYIDVEGEAKRPPVLLGVLRRKGRGPKPFVAHELVDPDYTLLAHLEGMPVRDLHAAILSLVARAEKKDRRIVAWSEHELDLVRTLDDPDLIARFEARFCNAKLLAHRWRAKCHAGSKPATERLRDYLDLVAYRTPVDAPYGEAAATIRAIRLRLERDQPPTELQLAKWRRLVEHNRSDCDGMRLIARTAAAELEAATG